MAIIQLLLKLSKEIVSHETYSTIIKVIFESIVSLHYIHRFF